MLLRGCARCGGDMFLEDSPGSVDVVCLQCGYRRIARFHVAAAREHGKGKKLSSGKKVGFSARPAA